MFKYHRGRPTYWTAARDEELVARYTAGADYYAIADAMGRSPEAIYRRCCVLGLRERTPAPREETP